MKEHVLPSTPTSSRYIQTIKQNKDFIMYWRLSRGTGQTELFIDCGWGGVVGGWEG